jgi:hypothetical protein
LEASERKLVTMIFVVLLASCNSFKPPCCRDGLVQLQKTKYSLYQDARSNSCRKCF